MRRLVPVLLLALTACGSSDPLSQPSSAPPATTVSSSPTPSALTKAAWVEAVNEICRDLEVETDKIGEPKTARDYADALNALVTALDAAGAKARAVAPPPAHEADIQTNFYAINEAQVAALRRGLGDVEAAAQADDLKAAEQAFGMAITQSQADATNNEKWMSDFGLEDCV